MPRPLAALAAAAFLLLAPPPPPAAAAFSPHPLRSPTSGPRPGGRLFSGGQADGDGDGNGNGDGGDLAVPAAASPAGGDRRRALLIGSAAAAASLAALAATPSPSLAVERAVGAAEASCKEAGDCLARGDWDGAVGWQWGGRDRCDATDPLCGPDGRVRDAPPASAPVPVTSAAVTDVIEIGIRIGKGSQASDAVLRIGLYGEACPLAAGQFVAFCTTGLTTSPTLPTIEGYGSYSAPVGLSSGASLTTLYPSARLEFGIPSQAAGYARTRSAARAGDGFVPQPRPPGGPDLDALAAERGPRPHDVPGLVSVPARGIGYGGTGRLEPDDEAYGPAFQITAAAVPSMDGTGGPLGGGGEGRRVVGQLLDGASMKVLARLASLPTNKGLKGIVPGQNYGPPLAVVRVTSVAASKVAPKVAAEGLESN